MTGYYTEDALIEQPAIALFCGNLLLSRMGTAERESVFL